jgi:hypothetical protein
VRRVESRYEKSRSGRTCSRDRFGYKKIYEGKYDREEIIELDRSYLRRWTRASFRHCVISSVIEAMIQSIKRWTSD